MDLLNDDEASAARTATMYRDMFGEGNFWLEIQNHGLEIEARIRERVRALSSRTGIPIVATNDCHYLRHEDAGAHDVLLCIQTGKSVHDEKRLRYETDQVYFKSADEMFERFAEFPDAVRATRAIAERCTLALSFGTPLLPEFPLPPGWSSADDYLRHLVDAGLATRYPGGFGEEIVGRARYELDVICRMG